MIILKIKNFTFELNSKILFEDFSAVISQGQKILLIGKNGTGKSSLLQLIYEKQFEMDENISVGLVEQNIQEFFELNGGARFNKKLSQVLNKDFILLDEPTNHLDIQNRASFLRFFKNSNKTFIIISHDDEILEMNFDQIWYIKNSKVEVFNNSSGMDIIKQFNQKREFEIDLKEKISCEIKNLSSFVQKKTQIHQKDFKKKDNEKIMASKKKDGNENSFGKIVKNNSNKIQELSQNSPFIEKNWFLNFQFQFNERGFKNLIQINEENFYLSNNFFLKSVNFSINSKELVLLSGKNGSGKSLFLKKLLNDKIGYIDQHYEILNNYENAYDAILKNSNFNEIEIRKHLNYFLFNKNNEVFENIKFLSNGEKLRLSIALICLDKNKELLLLDEITNNADLETKNYIKTLLENLNIAAICVIHDENFVKKIKFDKVYKIENNCLKLV